MAVVASALVAMRVTGTRSVEDAHHAPALAAAGEARQQGSSAAGRLALSALLHMRVLPQECLVLLELGPGQVALVVVADQHGPVSPLATMAARLARSTLDHAGAVAPTPEGIGAGVDRVLHDLHDAVVGRRPPGDAAEGEVASHDGQLHPDLARPEEDLARAAQLSE